MQFALADARSEVLLHGDEGVRLVVEGAVLVGVGVQVEDGVLVRWLCSRVSNRIWSCSGPTALL